MKKLFYFLLFFSLIVCLSSARLVEQKVTANEFDSSGFYSFSLDMYDKYAIIGAPSDGVDPGAAYIYERDGNNWFKQTKITADDGIVGDRFGWSTAIYGDYVIVGAGYYDNQKGAAYIFKRNGTSWTQEAKLTASDGADYDMFGWSVAIYGDYAIVGANGNDSYKGAAYIFKRNGTSWIQEAKITANDGVANDQFARAMDMYGDYAAITFHGNGAGVYIFKNNGSSWTQETKITPNVPYCLGNSITIYDDRLVLGESQESGGIGVIQIFKRNGTNWTREANISAYDGVAYDNAYFGSSVAIYGNYLIVGSNGDNSLDGSAYIYRYNNNNWVFKEKIIPSDTPHHAQFGYSIALYDNHYLVGAYGENSFSGSAYFFTDVGGARSFTGTPKDQIVLAPSNNIVVEGAGYTKYGSEDDVLDSDITVLEINGLVQEYASLVTANLGYTFNNNIYKGLTPEQTYGVDITVLSRGNDQTDGDTVHQSSTLTDSGAQTWIKNNPVDQNIYPWQIQTFTVSLNPTDAFAFERATLNTTISLVTDSTTRITSYNAFENAYLGGSYDSQGIYGGIQTMSTNTFTLEALGFDLEIGEKAVTVSAPAGYTGTPITEDNLVPGTKITFSILIYNNNSLIATSVNLTDVIPVNCHLYYTDPPTVDGATLWAWRGVTSNSADHNTPEAIKFEITIPAYGEVTAKYSVTVD